MNQLLRVENIHKHYGGVAALTDARFELQRGEVHALMGENGAGKSTLAKILAGSVKPDRGSIFVDGAQVQIASPLDAQRHGIGIIFQELDLFPHLTVAENIVVGNLRFPEKSLVNPRRMDDFCRPYLAQAGLDCSSRAFAGDLSIGQMQLLAIARALSMNARAILMDEPTSALFDDSVERLFRLIAELKNRGVSIVYVSHKMDEIFRICDRITVLRDGGTIGTVPARETNPEDLIRMMVGRKLEIAARHGGSSQTAAPDVVLKVDHLSTRKLRDVSFELRRGEVLGVAGLVGSGRSELGLALFGLDRRLAGTVLLNGKPIAPNSAADAMRLGIGLLPEDRKLEGLMMHMSILENSTLAVLAKISQGGFLRGAEERRQVQPVFQDLALKAAATSLPVSALSGGNQQKVLLTKCLLADPQVIFLDDPARGIDVGAKQDIYRIIRKMTASGKAVILVSSELPELLYCCDRIMVLREGRVTATFSAEAATQEAIMTAATLALDPEGTA